MQFSEEQHFQHGTFFQDSCPHFYIKNPEFIDCYESKQGHKPTKFLSINPLPIQQQNMINITNSQVKHSQLSIGRQFYEDKNDSPGQTKIMMMQNIDSSKQKLRQRMATIKGDRLQTQNTGKHMKTIINYILRLLMGSNLIEKSELVSVKKFMTSNGSINDFNTLFQNQNLRQKCREFISSHISIEIIMKSPNLGLPCKLLMVKYLQRLRMFTFGKQKNWKLKMQEQY